VGAHARRRMSGGPSRPCGPTAPTTCMCTTCRSRTTRRPAASPAT
jgi:hypothetical protein